MKNLLATLLLCSLSSLNAQSVSDYKYVIIPTSFNSFEENEYGLKNRVKYNLEQKNYVALTADQSTWPEEVMENPCLASTVNVNKKSSMLTNKLEVVFINCNQTNIGTYEGNSRIKQFDKGYQEAIKLAFINIGNQKAKPSNEVVKSTHKQKEIAITEKKSEQVQDSQTSNLYTYQGKKYQTANTTNGAFLLINTEDQKVVAQFYPSSWNTIYHVELNTNNGIIKTIGYKNDQSISIDTEDSSKKWSIQTYNKL